MSSFFCCLLFSLGLSLLFARGIGGEVHKWLTREKAPTWYQQQRAARNRDGFSFRSLTSLGRRYGLGKALALTRAVSVLLGTVVFGLTLGSGRVLLALPLALTAAALPWPLWSAALKKKEEKILGELECAMTLITSSYLRGGLFSDAVRENIGQIRPPVRPVLEAYLRGEKMVSADEKSLIVRMKTDFPDPFFAEWCDEVILTLEDRQLKNTLPWVVDRLNEKRLCDTEMTAKRKEALTEYGAMAALAAGNVPLMAMMNRSWFLWLVDSVPGQLMLGIVCLVLAASAMAVAGKMGREENG